MTTAYIMDIFQLLRSTSMTALFSSTINVIFIAYQLLWPKSTDVENSLQNCLLPICVKLYDSDPPVPSRPPLINSKLRSLFNII